MSEYYQNPRREMNPILPKQYRKVLEIGCGVGAFRSNLKLDNEYWGIEPVDAVAQQAKEKLDTVLIGLYEEVIDEIPNNYFDLVVCNDVIEHMVDHDKFLLSIKEKLAPNGCLVSSVPNVRYIGNLWEILINKDWQYRDEGILDRTHLRFFTEKSLKRTLADNGYQLEQFTPLNPYQPKSVAQRAVYFFTKLILGKDIQHLQFGIRITPKE